MPKPLRAALQSHLSQWRKDVPAAWQPVLQGVEPDFAKIPEHLTLEDDAPKDPEVIIPLRKGHNNLEAPVGSHVFKALDSVTPDRVRAVLVGQDPYPDIKNATGRSFEQGNHQQWGPASGKLRTAKSLRRVVAALGAHRQPDHGLPLADSAWGAWRAAFVAGRPHMQSPDLLFDHWAAQGVLCLNLGLTLSRFDKKGYEPPRRPAQAAHMAMWTPVIRQILLHLARRPQKELVVMLWGGPAQAAVGAMNLPEAARGAGNEKRLLLVLRDHPAAKGNSPTFLRYPSAFDEANDRLSAEHLTAIDW